MISVYCSHHQTGAFIAATIPDASWTAFSPITYEMFSAAVVVFTMAAQIPKLNGNAPGGATH